MIVGIVSDVHGNARGLATALARMGDVDVLLCAGDLVGQARDPHNGKRFSYAVLDTGSGHVRFDDYTGDDVAAHAREGLSTR